MWLLPTESISNPDPSTTWVHLHVLKIGRPIYNLLIHFSGKWLALFAFSKVRDPCGTRNLTVFTEPSSAALLSQPRYDRRMCAQDDFACRRDILAARAATELIYYDTVLAKMQEPECPSGKIPASAAAASA